MVELLHDTLRLAEWERQYVDAHTAYGCCLVFAILRSGAHFSATPSRSFCFRYGAPPPFLASTLEKHGQQLGTDGKGSEWASEDRGGGLDGRDDDDERDIDDDDNTVDGTAFNMGSQDTMNNKLGTKPFGGPDYRVDDPKADHTNAAIDASEARDFAFALRSFRAAAYFEPEVPEVCLRSALPPHTLLLHLQILHCFRSYFLVWHVQVIFSY